MRRKYKLTGCARFFMVMIILAPLAYLAASYYNGQDGIQNIKNLLGIESGVTGQDAGETAPAANITRPNEPPKVRDDSGADNTATDSMIKALQEENAMLKERIKQLEEQLKNQEPN